MALMFNEQWHPFLVSMSRMISVTCMFEQTLIYKNSPFRSTNHALVNNRIPQISHDIVRIAQTKYFHITDKGA